jgi:hypothetical protein
VREQIGVDPPQGEVVMPGPAGIECGLVRHRALRQRRCAGGSRHQQGCDRRRQPAAGRHLRHLRFPVIQRSTANRPIVQVSAIISP